MGGGSVIVMLVEGRIDLLLLFGRWVGFCISAVKDTEAAVNLVRLIMAGVAPTV